MLHLEIYLERQALKIGNQKVMAVSYPRGESTIKNIQPKAVIQTLKTYSKFTFDYPYPKAVSAHARNIGMEYL